MFWILILVIRHPCILGLSVKTIWAQCHKPFYDRNLQMFVKSFSLGSLSSLVLCLHWRQDTQLSDIQHNDTQHKGCICDTQHNNALRYAECVILFNIILNVNMMIVVMVNAIMLSVVAPFSPLFGRLLAQPINISSRINLIIRFGHKCTQCKLDHFIKISNICCVAMKRASLQKRVS